MMNIYFWGICILLRQGPVQTHNTYMLQAVIRPTETIDPSLLYKAKKWKMTSYLKEALSKGEFVETMENPVMYTFAEDGTYQYEIEGRDALFTGQWTLDPVTSILTLTDKANPTFTRNYTIIELTEKTLIISMNPGGPQESKITFGAE